jgi:hypothetical protein
VGVNGLFHLIIHLATTKRRIIKAPQQRVLWRDIFRGFSRRSCGRCSEEPLAETETAEVAAMENRW